MRYIGEEPGLSQHSQPGQPGQPGVLFGDDNGRGRQRGPGRVQGRGGGAGGQVCIY